MKSDCARVGTVPELSQTSRCLYPKRDWSRIAVRRCMCRNGKRADSETKMGMAIAVTVTAILICLSAT